MLCLKEEKNDQFNNNIICSNVNDLVDFINSNDSNNNTGIIAPLYIPYLKPKMVRLKTNKLREVTLFFLTIPL